MPVRVGVRLARRLARLMRMLVMRIVNMGVSVLQEIVLMLVFVNFRQVQPDAERHQQSCDAELKVTASPKNSIAAAAPRNGAVEK